MSLIPWKPFSPIDDFFNDESWLVPAFPRAELMRPAVDMYETDKEVIAEVSVPDYDADNIDISVEDGVLRVSGTIEQEEKEEKKGYWRREIRKGSFERSISIPTKVDEKEVKAEYKKGILKVTMPKVAPTKSEKIKIKVSKKD